MSLTLPRLPDARPLLLKALGTARRKVDAEALIPPLAVSVSGLRADARLIAQYREVCGFSPSDDMPITYPQVWATSLHLWLATQPSFPFPLLGMVHLRNRIEQTRPLAVDGVYEVRASIGEAQRIPAGVSFDFRTEFVDADGTVVYTAITTPLIRIKDPSRSKKAPAAPPPAALAEYESFSAPEDIGRRYAAVSMDYNPIHLHAWSAKLFGFPRAIAHGMWSVARCAALLEPRLDQASPSELAVQYRSPLLLPARAVLKHAATPGSGRAFELLAANAERTYLSGSLR